MIDIKWKEDTDEHLEVFLILSDFVFEYLVEDTSQDIQRLCGESLRNSLEGNAIKRRED